MSNYSLKSLEAFKILLNNKYALFLLQPNNCIFFIFNYIIPTTVDIFY